MPASKRRKPDPFLPPDHQEQVPDLVERAAPEKAGTLADETEPTPRLGVPVRRQPLKYKRPGASWVTFVVLGFAAVGVAAVGGTALKKVTGLSLKPITAPAPRPVAYDQLSKDDAILVTVQVSPRDARLLLDGEPMVSNPARITRSSSVHRISAGAPGYTGATQEFKADASRTLRFTLRK